MNAAILPGRISQWEEDLTLAGIKEPAKADADMTGQREE